MKALVWRNLNKKLWEATLVTRGRPLNKHVKDRVTRRLVVEGATKQEAIENLSKAIGSDVVVV